MSSTRTIVGTYIEPGSALARRMLNYGPARWPSRVDPFDRHSAHEWRTKQAADNLRHWLEYVEWMP